MINLEHIFVNDSESHTSENNFLNNDSLNKKTLIKTSSNHSTGLWYYLKSFFGTKSNSIEETVTDLIQELDPTKEKLSKYGKLILKNLIEFGSKTAEDIMTPRSDIVGISQYSSKEKIIEIYKNNIHTRMPVYLDTLDQIKGFIHIKDVVLKILDNQAIDIIDCTRKILMVPSSIRLFDLLQLMKKNRTHMSIIVDEYGGTDGMVTIEDIIEALIGEIYDEHDESSVEEDCQVINDVTLIATGRMKISELEKLLDIEFDNYNKEEYETLSGLIMDTTGLIPKIGDVIKLHKNVKAEIVDADLRSIKKIKLHLVDL